MRQNHNEYGLHWTALSINVRDQEQNKKYMWALFLFPNNGLLYVNCMSNSSNICEFFMFYFSN